MVSDDNMLGHFDPVFVTCWVVLHQHPQNKAFCVRPVKKPQDSKASDPLTSPLNAQFYPWPQTNNYNHITNSQRNKLSHCWKTSSLHCRNINSGWREVVGGGGGDAGHELISLFYGEKTITCLFHIKTRAPTQTISTIRVNLVLKLPWLFVNSVNIHSDEKLKSIILFIDMLLWSSSPAISKDFSAKLQWTYTNTIPLAGLF